MSIKDFVMKHSAGIILAMNVIDLFNDSSQNIADFRADVMKDAKETPDAGYVQQAENMGNSSVEDILKDYGA